MTNQPQTHASARRSAHAPTQITQATTYLSGRGK